jgi:DNA polymerase I-like protein with 3'-5' exonuclease and polymerase domains
MQSSASDMIKLAMKKFRRTDFYKKYYPDRKVEIILQVHDGLVVRAHKSISAEGAVILKGIMIEVAEAIHPGIKGGVSGGIIQNWSQKD